MGVGLEYKLFWMGLQYSATVKGVPCDFLEHGTKWNQCLHGKLRISCRFLKPLVNSYKKSVAWVRERTIPTKRPPLVGKVSANFLGNVCHVVGTTNPLWSYSRISRPKPLLFLSSSSSIVLNEAEWTQFQTHYFSENLVAKRIEPGPLDL
jgi:hypothetical protein